MKKLLYSTVPLLLLVLGFAGCPAGGGAGRGAVAPSPPADAHEAARLTKLAQLELDGKQRDRLVKLANETRCPCGQARASLAECAASCVRGPFALRAIGRYIARELADDQIASLLLERFGPREREQIDVTHAPCAGSAAAPVTMVVFSDFQCPFCALGAAMIREVEKRAGDTLRVCFKSFLIHQEAEPAVRAAFAAHRQGKFWPFHDKLFVNQRAQSQDDLLAYAKELGLDIARWQREMDSAEAKNAVLRDGLDAQRLRLRGTPSFFVNGRPFSDPKNVPTFLDWIEEELALKKGAASRPASAPAGHKS